MKNSPRLLRITTVPISLKLLLTGQLPFMTQQGFDVLAVSADGPEVASIVAGGIRHEVVHMTRKITPVQDLVSLIALVKLMRRFKPDIVHTHTPKAGLLGMLAAWICRVPVRLHTVAGLPVMEAAGLKRKVLLLTEWITYAAATGVYPNSEGLRQFMKTEIQGQSGKYKIIGKGSSNGIDSRFFMPSDEVKQAATRLREQLNIIAGETVYCFVGRIVRDKGIDELVEAFEAIARQQPARLLLVGPFEDDLDPVSDRTKVALKNNPKIVQLGYQNDVRPALYASDVFVFPSYREGFPNVVMQACCLERPCIVSDINGCNEIIQDRVTGIIVKPKTVAPLQEAMQFMAMQPHARAQWGARARDHVAAHFERHHVWSLILDEYKYHLNLVR